MSNPRDRREGRVSAARRRAETHSSGFEGTCLRLPDGLSFWEPKAGIVTVDVIPYIAGKGNPLAKPGELYFERTFYTWKGLGPDNKQSYCCLHKNFGKPDPIADYKTAQARNPDADHAYLATLKPKERQLFLISEVKNPGIKLWEVSYFNFGKLLDSRIKLSEEEEGWDLFYEKDEYGMSLRLTFVEEAQGSFKWLDVVAIDFIKRGALAPALANHTYCLDEMLVEKPYKELERIFLNISSGDEPAGDEEEAEQPKTEARREMRTEKEATPDKPAEKPAEKPPAKKTAAELGITRAIDVMYKGGVCTVLKVSADGSTLTLSDANDEPISSVPVEDVKLIKEAKDTKSTKEPAAETRTEKKAVEATAEKTTATKGNSAVADDWDF